MIFYSWQIFDFDWLDCDPFWNFNSSLQNLFKVKDISNLTWLSYPKPIIKSFPTIVCKSILSTVSKATVHEVWAYKCTSPSLTSVAMNSYYIIGILLQEIVNLLTSIYKCAQIRCMMVQPLWIVRVPSLKLRFLKIIIFLFWKIDDPPFVIMILSEHLSDCLTIVPVQFLNALGTCRPTHCDDPWSDISHIKVEAIFLVSFFLAGNKFAN